jgi:hypothetical protein
MESLSREKTRILIVAILEFALGICTLLLSIFFFQIADLFTIALAEAGLSYYDQSAIDFLKGLRMITFIASFFILFHSFKRIADNLMKYYVQTAKISDAMQAKTLVVQATRFCPNCQQSIHEAKAKFCPHCS